MKHEGHSISRAQFEQNLDGKQIDPEFMNDISPLLNPAVDYDPVKAMNLVRDLTTGYSFAFCTTKPQRS